MKFSNTKIPKKITPCPIEEAVFEIRFESSLPEEVLPGLVFSALNGAFPKVSRLPILEMPEIIRKNEPGLEFAAHHVLTDDKYRLQIGPKSLSVVCPNEYVGWTEFVKKIETVIDMAVKINLIKVPIRTGLRYSNILKGQDIFKNTKVDILLDGNSLIGQSNTLRSEFLHEGFLCILNISNQMMNHQNEKASLFDIDVIQEFDGKEVPNFIKVATRSHDIEKELFFGLITDDYLKTLNPEY